MNRRNLLKTLAFGAIGASAGSLSAQEAGQPRRQQTGNSSASAMRPLRMGVASLHIADGDLDAWARRAVERKFRAVNAPSVNLDDKDHIKAIIDICRKHDLMIAEVGRWVNLMDADPEKRAANMKIVTDGLALAEELGAKCCVDIAGSFSEKHWAGPHPKNVSKEFFDLAVENARKIIDAVKPTRTKFTYEMMPWALPDTADSYLRLIEAIDRPGFGVHLDIANMINSPDKFWNQTRMINETFDKLGPWIASAHFKDLEWVVPEYNVYFRECVIGKGDIDFATYLTRMAKLPHDVPVMIEHMKNAEEYDLCRDHLFKVGESVGVSFV